MIFGQEFPRAAGEILACSRTIVILNGFTRRRRVKPFTKSKLTWQLLENDLGLLYEILFA